MRERPILFSGPMVRAILEGLKTETRRVVKHPARLDGFMLAGEEPDWCPYGGPGDRLWVREAHAIVPATAYGCSRDDGAPIAYRTSPDGLSWAIYREGWTRCKPGRWRPSIHMPRWASRLLLEVTGVRIERIRDISGVEAVAEGFGDGMPEWKLAHAGGYGEARRGFRKAWDRLNAGRGFGWDDNPLVWVVGFEVVKKTGRYEE